MFIVGLTGGIATGKSTVLSIFEEHGVAVISADNIARKVLEPGTKEWHELIAFFGDKILLPDGEVDRVRLGEIIFDDVELTKKLNEITHPKIQSVMVKMAVKYFFSGHTYIVMEVPLLFGTGKMLKYMHKIITVVCEDHQQLARLWHINKMDLFKAIKLIQNQMPLKYKISESHFVIDNSGDLSNLRKQTGSIKRTLERSKFTWYFHCAIFIIFMFCVLYSVIHIFRKLLELF